MVRAPGFGGRVLMFHSTLAGVVLGCPEFNSSARLVYNVCFCVYLCGPENNIFWGVNYNMLLTFFLELLMLVIFKKSFKFCLCLETFPFAPTAVCLWAYGCTSTLFTHCNQSSFSSEPFPTSTTGDDGNTTAVTCVQRETAI